MNSMQKIAVVGTSCSGKSTFAEHLSRRTGIPHVRLDELYWKPNWTEKPVEEFRRLVGEATSRPQWIVDGNYSKTRDLVWPRADTLIWLNYPFPIVFGRAFRRTVHRVFTREKLFAGNRESFWRSFFSHKSILLWVVQSHGKLRRRYPKLFDEPDHRHLTIVDLSHPKDADRFLDALDLKAKS